MNRTIFNEAQLELLNVIVVAINRLQTTIIPLFSLSFDFSFYLCHLIIKKERLCR